jgi:phosphoribosylamine--glycine ligase
MRVLVIGSGGREHALAWKIKQSTLVEKVYCAPGNGGIAGIAECVDIKPDDITGLIGFATRNKIDLTVVGPEAPLAQGIVDRFCVKPEDIRPDEGRGQDRGQQGVHEGPYAQDDIPTAEFEVFDDSSSAKSYIKGLKGNFVVKADGPRRAGSGGLLVKGGRHSGRRSMMERRAFRDAGSK